jgi:iron complex transport system substrate-binding protein
MKKALVFVFAFVLLLSLAGCANSSSNTEPGEETAGVDSSAQDTTDDSVAADENGETRTIQTTKGEVEVPANPQRIVSDYYLGEFLALGVKPIIASPYSLNNPFLAGLTDGIEELNITSAETSLEMITAAEPDLIFTLNEADYENYVKIAPTVLILDGEQTPEERFHFIGEVLGKKDEAVAYTDAFKVSAAEVKDEINSIVDGRTVSFIEVWPSEIYVMGSHFARGGSILFDLWGLKAPEVVQTEMVDGDTQYDTVSLEVLPEYAGDFVFFSTLAGAESEFVTDSAVWKNLPAVKNGLVKEYEQVAFMHTDPITLQGQLDFYTEYFRSLEG